MCKTLERLKEIGALNRNAKCPYIDSCRNSKTEEHPDGCKLIETLEVMDGANKIVTSADLNYYSIQK